MNDDAPGLGVSFGIDFGDSFGGLKTLDDLIGATAANAVRDFQKLQGAISGGMGLKEASREWVALGRETRNAAQDSAKFERSTEALVRSLERQNATFGLSKDQIQSNKIAAAALQAEQRNMIELANRLRTEEALLNAQREKAAASTAAANMARDAAAADAVWQRLD